MTQDSKASIDLYWLPLGAGGHFVRLNGRLFEAVAARLERRPTRDLYHSALEVSVPDGKFVIEMAPVAAGAGATRGVVAEGPVGSSRAQSLRIFRYESRCWRDGVIPDLAEAAESPQRLTDDPVLVQRVLDLVPRSPTTRLGTRRAGRWRNVELELPDLLAARTQRDRCRGGAAADPRPRSGMARWCRRRPPARRVDEFGRPPRPVRGP
jgi:hypothetical protein